MNEETKNLLNIAKKLAGKQLITYDELNGFVSDVANLLAQYRSATSQINKETKDTLNTLVKALNDAHSQIISQQESKIDTKVSREMDKMSKLTEDCKKMCEEMLTMKPKDGKDGEPGKDGKDADEEKIVSEVLKKIPEATVDLEPLKEEIEGKFTKVYDHIKKSINGFPGVRQLVSLMDVKVSSPTNGQALVYNSTTNMWENGTVTGGSGITRSINSISSPTTAGATASTDYVYLVSGTTTLTMPTAVGNTNRYTIKNSGSDVVTIDTTGGQTIDGNATHTLNVPYAVDLISNNSNWFII